MVDLWAHLPGVVTSFLVAQATEMPVNRLESVARVKLLGALILLTIGGTALVFLSWLALRVGRRSLHREDAKVRQLRARVSRDDWASKPLVQPDRNRPDQDHR